VHNLALVFSTDKTEVAKDGHKTMQPVYMSIGNFDQSIYAKDEAMVLVGFVPVLPYSKAEIFEILGKNGITSEKGSI
jgi:hypothetical protein